MKYQVKKNLLGFNNINEVELEKHDGITTLLHGYGDEDSMNLILINASTETSYFEIPSTVKALLDIEPSSNISVYFTVIISKDINKSRIQLGAPLIFNNDNNTMAQAVMDISSMSIEELQGLQAA